MPGGIYSPEYYPTKIMIVPLEAAAEIRDAAAALQPMVDFMSFRINPDDAEQVMAFTDHAMERNYPLSTRPHYRDMYADTRAELLRFYGELFARGNVVVVLHGPDYKMLDSITKPAVLNPNGGSKWQTQ